MVKRKAALRWRLRSSLALPRPFRLQKTVRRTRRGFTEVFHRHSVSSISSVVWVGANHNQKVCEVKVQQNSTTSHSDPKQKTQVNLTCMGLVLSHKNQRNSDF